MRIPTTVLAATLLMASFGSTALATESAVLSYPIVDTGQVSCYDDDGVITCPEEGEAFFGQDGNYEGNQPGYQDNGDGTVTDLVTGLMWQGDPGDKMTLTEAAAGVDDFELAGYDDWRLPTIKELYSLILFSGTDVSVCMTTGDCDGQPFISDVFAFEYGDVEAGERYIDSQWATSTLYESYTMGDQETMFGVNFADGRIKGYGLQGPGGGEMDFFTIFVRGDPDYGINDFVGNGDGTVSDLATGLMWQQSDSVEGMDWSESLEYCSALDVGGSADWRLPDAKELQSIVDYSRSPATTDSAAIDPVFEATEITVEDGSADYAFYWSGTTHASVDRASSAAYVAFGESYGWMEDRQSGELALVDVHGAGSQRSDPKTGDAGDWPTGHGPQGDVIRIDNLVRCVRAGEAETVTGYTGGSLLATTTTTTATADSGAAPPAGPGGQGARASALADAAETLGVSEADLVAALGEPGSRAPDFKAAAKKLGVSATELRAVLPPPPDASP